MRSTQSYLTPDEVIAVLRAAKERSARDWAMVLVAYRHGILGGIHGRIEGRQI